MDSVCEWTVNFGFLAAKTVALVPKPSLQQYLLLSGPYLWSKAYQLQWPTLLDHRHRLEHKRPYYITLAQAKKFFGRPNFFFFFWEIFVFGEYLRPVSLDYFINFMLIHSAFGVKDASVTSKCRELIRTKESGKVDQTSLLQDKYFQNIFCATPCKRIGY